MTRQGKQGIARRIERAALLLIPALGLAVLVSSQLGARPAPRTSATEKTATAPTASPPRTARVVVDAEPQQGVLVLPEERAAVPSTAGHEPGQRAFVAVVRMAETHAPVAGAVVRCSHPPSTGTIGRGEARPHGVPLPETVFRHPGRASAVVTDAEGRALVPSGATGWLVTASRGDARGHAFVPPGLVDDPAAEASIVIDLHAARDLVVQTVAPDGRPLPGVPIGIRFGGADGPGPFRPVGRSTGHDALCVCPPLDGIDLEAIRVEVAALTVDGVEPVRVESPHGAEAPLVLAVPELGRVSVRVLDRQGRALDGVPVALAPAGDGRDRRPGHPAIGTTDAEGRVSFDAIPVGSRLTAVCSRHGQMVRRDVVGPSRPGQTTAVEVFLDRTAVALSGVAVGRDGHEIPNRRLQLRVVDDPDLTTATETDDGGRFRFELPARLAGQRLAAATISLIDSAGRLTWSDASLTDLSLSFGDTRLGVVALEATPIVVAGSIDAPAGCPPVIVVEREDPDGTWRSASGVGARPTTGDRFEFVGRTSRGPHRLRALAAGCVPLPPVPFTPGASDLAIRLELGATVAVTFTRSADPDGFACEARLLPLGAALPPSRAAQHVDFDAHRTARREWSGVAAGRYEVEVRSPGSAWTKVDAVTVPPASAGETVSLGPVDLAWLPTHAPQAGH